VHCAINLDGESCASQRFGWLGYLFSFYHYCQGCALWLTIIYLSSQQT
jgi:hypothetical protein